ncbi:hypothetical protein BDW74DRAFT_143058 [Aspergillus multicolor]|uniref:uncharacterized protein n=1 Tax=Aspergillus multicolor TaxID=41759 RepID=UPI003CCD4792
MLRSTAMLLSTEYRFVLCPCEPGHSIDVSVYNNLRQRPAPVMGCLGMMSQITGPSHARILLKALFQRLSYINITRYLCYIQSIVIV